VDETQSLDKCFIVLPDRTLELAVGDAVFDDVEQKKGTIKEILRGIDGKIVMYLDGIERGRHLWELRPFEESKK